MKIDSYNFSNYEWFVKLKTKNSTKGFFVVVPIYKGLVVSNYPQDINNEFAFCPSVNIKQFESAQGNFKELPDYIIIFKKSELESLIAVIPLHI